MPNNVPSKPSKGETVVVVSKIGKNRSSRWKYFSPTSCTFRSTCPTPKCRNRRTAAKQAATGPGRESQARIASS